MFKASKYWKKPPKPHIRIRKSGPVYKFKNLTINKQDTDTKYWAGGESGTVRLKQGTPH